MNLYALYWLLLYIYKICKEDLYTSVTENNNKIQDIVRLKETVIQFSYKSTSRNEKSVHTFS
uniref:Uncharacterized protein n=1 Tax=Arion vulgaris TaxID=1028688 RepID=A0A0B6ZEZ2_9EUPU